MQKGIGYWQMMRVPTIELGIKKWALTIFIKEVHYLHFVGEMDANKITDFYFLHQSPNEIKEESMDEFFDYIKHIIAIDNRDFV